MNYKWLLLVLGIVSGNVHSFESQIEIIEYFDDIKLVAFISKSDIQNYPLWKPLSETPPLSINKAIEAVAALDNRNASPLMNRAVKEIELREISGHTNYWHYLVKIKLSSDKMPKYHIYVVLMNGKVIPANIVTESYK